MGYSCNACGRYVDGGGSCGCYAPSPQPSIETKLREMLAAKSADLAAARAEVERLREELKDALEAGNDGDWQSARKAIEAALKGDAA